MKVLQVGYKLPFPPNDGGAYSLYNSALSLIGIDDIDLKILTMKQKKNKDDSSLIPNSFIDQTQFEYVEIDNRIKPIKALLTLFESRSYFAHRFYSKEFENKLVEILEENSFDIIQLEHSYLGVYIEPIKKNFDGKVILRAQNVEFKLWENYIESRKFIFPIKLYLKSMTKRLEKMEAQLINKVDGLICLSEADKNRFLKMNNHVRNVVIPIGFDEEKLQTYDPIESTDCVYHLGSMDWMPNVQGVEWFLNQVLPEIRKKDQNVKVHFAGKNMSDRFKNISIDNVIIDGEIQDAIQYQSNKSILIVPLLTGGGIRVKIIEALALGKVIISTSKGAEGLLITHGKNILIADTPEMFAKSIIACLESPHLMKKLSSNARELYDSHYKLSVTGQQKKIFYQELLST